MTVPSTASKSGPSLGDGAATSFVFDFKVFTKADIEVVLTDTNGIDTTLVLDSDYSVVLNTDRNTSPGGTVTYPITGSPLPAGASLVVARDVAYTQETDITNAGGFYPQVIEDALDKSTMLIQQLLESTSRAVGIPLSEDGGSFGLQLPSAGKRASQFLAFDANGNVVVSDGTGADAGLRTDLASTDPSKGAALVGSAVQIVRTLATAKSIPGTTSRDLYVAGRASNKDGYQGQFSWDGSDLSAKVTNDPTNAIYIPPNTDTTGASGAWVRVFTGPVLAEWCGLDASSADNSTALQAALNLSSDVAINTAGTYNYAAPLQLKSPEGGKKRLSGLGRDLVFLVKTTNTAGTGSNTVATGGTDSYAVDAGLIMEHPDNTYNYNTEISGITFKNTANSEIGIYAPRASHLYLHDVNIKDFAYGFETHDCWLSTFRKMELQGYNYSGALDSIAVYWKPDGTNTGGMGTTCHFDNVWVRDYDGAFYLYNLKYSAMTCCAADHINKNNKASYTSVPYYFHYSGVALNGCGTEDADLPNASAGVFTLNGAKVTANNCYTARVTNTSNSSFLRLEGSAVLILNSCSFNPVLNTLGYNTFTAGASKLFINGSSLPTNANTFDALAGNSFHVTDGITVRNADGVVSTNTGAFTKRFTFDNSFTPGSSLIVLPVGAVVTGVRCYLTSNSSSFSQLKLTDQNSTTTYLQFDAHAQALNTWVNYSPPVPQLVIDSSTDNLSLFFSGGVLGAVGVVEISYYYG